MIYPNHGIAYKNVVSKYYKFAPAELDVAIEDLHRLIEEQGYHIVGNFFYSMLSDPRDEEIMVAEIFMPIVEDHFQNKTDEEMFFRSYFNIKPMVVTRVMDNVEEESQVKYWDLQRYLNTNGFEQSTPVFVEFKADHEGKSYVEMSTGIRTTKSIFN